jgi:hypothetical protein
LKQYKERKDAYRPDAGGAGPRRSGGVFVVLEPTIRARSGRRPGYVGLMKRLLASSAAVVALGAGVIAGSAPADTSTAATPKITGAGAGKVKLHATYTSLRKRGLVGKIGPGCELGGPNTRSAKLKAPLKGFVNFTLKNPRKVTDITITGGATARGVGVGGSLADIHAAYPKAKDDHSTDDTFGATLVNVPKSDGGKIMFAVDTTTKAITQIGIPGIGFCE